MRIQKKTNTVYQLKDMEPGDRFYFNSDSKKRVWQVTRQTADTKTIEQPDKKENVKNWLKRVVYLRTVGN